MLANTLENTENSGTIFCHSEPVLLAFVTVDTNATLKHVSRSEYRTNTVLKFMSMMYTGPRQPAKMQSTSQEQGNGVVSQF